MPSNQPHLSSYMNSGDTAAAIIIPSTPQTATTTPTTPTATNPNSNNSTPNASSRVVQQKNPKLYKTELCRSWMETGRCNYGERCQYAHGENEKRPVPRHPKYKTEPCQSYHKTGYCPYGPRCHFIHNESPAQLKTLINANEQALQMVQDLAALGIEPPKKTTSMLTTSSSAASLGAYASQKNNNSNSSSSPYGVFPAQKSNSAVQFMNGNHQFLGKAQSFGNNRENMLIGQSQVRQTKQRQMGMNFGAGNGNPLLGTSFPETNNFAKNFWSNEIPSGNQQQIMPKSPILDANRPNTLELYANSGFHSQQISPTFFTPLDELIRQQNKSPNFALLAFGNEKCSKSMNGPTIPSLAGNNNIGDEMDPQQLLGNLCSSDDEYSRASIISSNIDSGNESPLATFDEEARIRQQIEEFKKSHTPLPAADEPQPRRSSDGDTTSNNAAEAVAIVGSANNNSTASSSMASLLSSSSTNSSTYLGHKFQMNSSNFGAIQSTSPNSQKIRLPVFERLSLNQ